MELKDCTEGSRYREAAMAEALRCREGEFNHDTIMDYIGFACGICGAGNTLVLSYQKRIFHVSMIIVEDLENAE